jgi:putative transcriptional regulator
MDKTTLRQVEELCLPPRREFDPADIRRIRLASHVSQAVFASYLGVGVSTVQQWEQGHKKPAGSAARLLDVIDRKGLQALV